ncbi:MAG: SCP2 sterol-binding domain-containing protein [Candidatus Wallbacteria bacterium]|nr:SCP2 sterol-binding domain-containing protein [Candidatus Wallbacteria bacterium]
MTFFQDEKHLYKCLGGLFEKVRRDAMIGPKLATAALVIRFLYEEPEGQITIDLKTPPGDGTFFSTFYGKNDLEADVVMSMKADVGHRFWFGKVNLVAALTRRQIVAKGPIPKILKLLPAIQPTYAMYPEILKELGEDKILLA